MAAPKQHGAGYPGVPTTPLSNGSITAQSILPKAGSNKPAAKPLRMVTPVKPVYNTPNKSKGGKLKATGGAAKMGTFGSRMGF